MRWACPKCGATATRHGKGGGAACTASRHSLGRHSLGGCVGFLCICETPESDQRDHGSSFANPCKSADCNHCGWFGEFPPKPKKLLPWEKKALEAGWAPPKGWKTEKRGE